VTAAEHTRRVWSEFVPFADLCSVRTLRPLAERGIQLLVATTPEDAAGLSSVIGTCRELGVSVGAGAMLERAAGRWPNVENLERWRAFTERTLETLAARDLLPETLAVDLEPPMHELDGALHGSARVLGRWTRRRGVGRARAELSTFVEGMRARGLEVLAATIPAVLADPKTRRGWQRALGTPVDRVGFDRVSPMAYTSLFAGYSRGLIRREDALSLLAMCARASRARWGDRAGICLGTTGPGVLGDEPAWDTAEMLAEDVAEARAAGVEDIAVFDLTGMLARRPVERWLDALVETEPAPRSRRLTPRAAVVTGAVRAASLAFAL